MEVESSEAAGTVEPVGGAWGRGGRTPRRRRYQLSLEGHAGGHEGMKAQEVLGTERAEQGTEA